MEKLKWAAEDRGHSCCVFRQSLRGVRRRNTDKRWIKINDLRRQKEHCQKVVWAFPHIYRRCLNIIILMSSPLLIKVNLVPRGGTVSSPVSLSTHPYSSLFFINSLLNISSIKKIFLLILVPSARPSSIVDDTSPQRNSQRNKNSF